MTAPEILDTLALKWPDDTYIKIHEAPDAADRRGRKIDCLVISTWASRGFERDAVEIKVSVSDYTRELENPEKADWWWKHSHRFWIAAPAELADRIRPTLPSPWGLLAVEPGRTPAVAVKPEKHEPEPLPWGSVVGCMRASADFGYNAMRRAEDRGRAEGRKAAEAASQRNDLNIRTQEALERLQAKVRAYKEASGIDIEAEWHAENLGKAVALVRKAIHAPDDFCKQIDTLADHLHRRADSTKDLADALRQAMETPCSPTPA